MEEENIAIRLKSLIQDLRITNSVFAEKCGISRATLSQLLTGRNKKISDIVISQIHAAYPGLSIMWLLFNEGEMWPNGRPANAGNEADGQGAQCGDTGTKGDTKEGDGGNQDFAMPGFPDSPKKPSENQESPASVQPGNKNAKENGVNQSEKVAQASDAKGINDCLNGIGFLNEIENLRRKARKVVQITVYYDDSTFESFYPG